MNVIDYITITCIIRNVRWQITFNYMKNVIDYNRLRLLHFCNKAMYNTFIVYLMYCLSILKRLPLPLSTFPVNSQFVSPLSGPLKRCFPHIFWPTPTPLYINFSYNCLKLYRLTLNVHFSFQLLILIMYLLILVCLFLFFLLFFFLFLVYECNPFHIIETVLICSVWNNVKIKPISLVIKKKKFKSVILIDYFRYLISSLEFENEYLNLCSRRDTGIAVIIQLKVKRLKSHMI